MPLWEPKMNALFPNTTKVCSSIEQTNKTVCSYMCADVNLEAANVFWFLLPSRSNVSSLFERHLIYFRVAQVVLKLSKNYTCAFEQLTFFEKQTVHQTNERSVN